MSPADLTEDGAVDSVTGLLVVADADPGESRFQAGTTTGVYGVFEIDGDGLWRYQLGNSLASVQSLQAGDAVRETITVHSVDGTPHQMVFTVHGAADAPVLVAEAQTLTEGGRRISGRMIALDADAGDQLTFSSHTPIPGFTLHSDGSYTFDPSVPAYDALGPNARQIVSIPVTVTDSTGLSDTKALEITVTGSNDGPTLSLTPPQSLLEGAPVYRGRFTAQDVDAGDSLTYGLTQPVPGMSLSPDGAFRFDAGDPAFDHLAFDDKLVMSVPVTVTDRQGASDTQVMEIAVVGTNDAPMLSVAPPQTVDEGAGAVHGRFVATDVDDGDVLTFGAAQSVPGFTIAPDGSYRFDPTVSAYDHLYAGEQQVLSIPVTVRDAHGASDQQIVQITVTGTNDVPIVAGLDHSVAAVSGATNGHATASGSLAVLDLDSGESHFAGQVLSGHYGTLAISADGTWTYSADANQKAFTQMPQGGHLEETFTVRTADGTSHDITVRIVGSNQPAIIAGTRQALVQEDQPGTIAHRLTIADPDAHQAAFQPVDQDLKYGHFTLSADGGWTYRVDNGNPAVQALGAGDPLVERIMVGSVDGTPQVIEVTIVGANDAPVIGGVNTATLSEDVAATGGRLAASGRLTIQDVDAGEARFTPFQGFPGDQGYGTFAIDVDGVWTYEVDNSQPAVQQLKPHERIADSVSAISADGSRHTITVTIEGTNDAPVLQAQSQSVTEDGAVLHGRMQASDVDSGDTQSFSTTATVPGFTLNADG
ncbi:MAG: VCBS domain-containing protein, partial [Alphaproteobacteria bacterium]|nr:VCBS domain-containing protein [Alphaproteobacteria bacterium]